MFLICAFAAVALPGIIFYRLGYAAGRSNGHHEAGCQFGDEVSSIRVGKSEGEGAQVAYLRELRDIAD